MYPTFVTPLAMPLSGGMTRAKCERRRTRMLLGQEWEYAESEGLNDIESVSSMKVWNMVIHKSLKRKLQGLTLESPVALGVGALMRVAPGYAGLPLIVEESMHHHWEPVQVVKRVLYEFQQDALKGATLFIQVASVQNHVKRSTPRAFLLFIGDNDNYKALLHLKDFECGDARFERHGEECVVGVKVRSTQGEEGVFEFVLERVGGVWLIEELFRL